MKLFYSKMLIFSMLVIYALNTVGCATKGQTGALVGGTLGAIAGGIIGNAVGGKKGAAVGVAAGAALGAGIGWSIGKYVEEQTGDRAKALKKYAKSYNPRSKNARPEIRAVEASLASKTLTTPDQTELTLDYDLLTPDRNREVKVIKQVTLKHKGDDDISGNPDIGTSDGGTYTGKFPIQVIKGMEAGKYECCVTLQIEGGMKVCKTNYFKVIKAENGYKIYALDDSTLIAQSR